MFVHLITYQAKKKIVHLVKVRVHMFVVWFLSSNAPEGLNSGRGGRRDGCSRFFAYAYVVENQ